MQGVSGPRDAARQPGELSSAAGVLADMNTRMGGLLNRLTDHMQVIGRPGAGDGLTPATQPREIKPGLLGEIEREQDRLRQNIGRLESIVDQVASIL